MNDMVSSKPDLSGLPEPVLRTTKRQFSIVWLVPVIAALIGGWLIYRALSEKGPEVFITFKTAEGIEVGKTKIKYKDVEIGQVTGLSLTPDLSHVVVKAEFVREATAYLTENTRFWVTKARVGAFGVSGLSTLFSGVYIDVDPGKPGNPQLEFTGLEEPPLVTTVDPGRVFILQAARKGSIEIGSPIFYRQIMVGKVISYNLAEDGSNITFHVFINAPFHQHVRKNTRFWNASGLNVKLDATGIGIQTESFVSMLVGGIAFDIVDAYNVPEDAAGDQHIFSLYASHEDALKKIYTEKTRYILYFNGSVRGLSPGAPVEFRGIQIGEVIDLKMEYNADKKSFEIPVLIVIEPGRIELKKNTTYKHNERVIDFLVTKGFRAQLKPGNIVTGQMYVSLDFFPDAKPERVQYGDIYPIVPTMPAPIEEIGSKINQLFAKLEKLPIDEIGNDLKDTIQGAKQFANSSELIDVARALKSAVMELQMLTADIRLQTVPEANAALEQARKSLSASQSFLDTDSPMQIKLKEALTELSGAATSLRILMEYLESHPESIVTGKGSEK